jgi:hypothetical protein
MASPPSGPMRPPPNYIPNPNPNQNPNLSGSFQNLQISGPPGVPAPQAATSGSISRPGPPPPSALSRAPFPSNGPTVAPPSGPPSMIRAPMAQPVRASSPGSPPSTQPFNAPPGRPTPSSYMPNPNLNPASQPLQMAPGAAQPVPAIGLAPPQPNSVTGTTGVQPFASRALGPIVQRSVGSPFPGSLNQNALGFMGPRSLPGLPGSQPYSGLPAPGSQPGRGPIQSFPGQPVMRGQPTMGQLSMGQPQTMGLQNMVPPPMGAPAMGPPPMGAPAMGPPMGAPMGSAAAPFSAPAWQSQQKPVGFASKVISLIQFLDKLLRRQYLNFFF